MELYQGPGVILMFLFWGTICQQKADCSTFGFPTLDPTLTVTVEENEELTLPFTLSDRVRRNMDNFLIKVKTDRKTLCDVFVSTDACNPSPGCGCSAPGSYWVNVTVTREDDMKNVTFTLINKEPWSETTEAVRLNVTYPVRLVDFHVGRDEHELPGPVSPGHQVIVHCQYQEGKPAALPTILDRHGDPLELEVTRDVHVRRVTHRFQAVECDDAGTLRCEAPRADDNKTLTLLVTCPPEFISGQNQTMSMDGNRHTLTFKVRMHTNITQGYSLTRIDSGGVQTCDCNSSIKVTGDPPDLQLTLQLDTVTSQDYGQWRLSVTNDAGTGQVDFWIHSSRDSTRIQSLMFEVNGSKLQRPTDEGDSVSVQCSYSQGTSSVTPTLLDRRGNTLTTQSSSCPPRIRHDLDHISCDDAGVFVCEAPGASQNQTATLLVRCAPEFTRPYSDTVMVEAGDDVEIQFPVRTHTTQLTDCQLTKTPSADGFFDTRAVVDCMGFVKLKGRAPDLRLVLQLTSVGEEDEGQWLLTVTNSNGSGRVNFTITLTEGHVIQIVGLAVGGFVILATITVIVICHRQGRNRSSPAPPVVELVVLDRHSLSQDDVISLHSHHVYNEVQDVSSTSTETDNDGQQENSLRSSFNPESRDDAGCQSPEGNVVPLYENTQAAGIGRRVLQAAGGASDNMAATVNTTNPDVYPCTAGTSQMAGRFDADADSEYVGYDPRMYENTES